MSLDSKRDHAVRALVSFGLATIGIGVTLALTDVARSDTKPIGPLPAGLVSNTATGPGQLLAVALPHELRSSGLVWRIARRYDSGVVRQVSEADVGANVVFVFRIVGRGNTSLVFALTRGDTSQSAVKSATHRIHSA